MSAQNNGGPAFPVSTGNPDDGHQDSSSTCQFPGMTLRDYFAAKIAPTFINFDVSDIKDVRPGETVAQWIARKSYAMADAMLEARKK